MKRYIILLLAIIISAMKVSAQSGTYQYDMKLNDGRTYRAQRAEPQFKFTDYNCYWFAKPGQDHYFFCNNKDNMGIIILRGRAMDTTFVYQDKYNGEQIFFQVYDTKGQIIGIAQPDSQTPINLHYNTLSASEVSLTFTGPILYIDQKSGQKTPGTVTSNIHLYREGRYEKSDLLPGCDCDPTIYAYGYNPEVGRTPSDCENAVLWRTFNTVQKAIQNVIPNASFTGNSNDTPTGALIYNGTKGGPDFNVPLSDIVPCYSGNRTRRLVSVDAHKHIFERDDYAEYFIKKPDPKELMAGTNGLDMKGYMLGYMKMADSLSKLMMAKKITADQMKKATDAYAEKMNAGQPDIKKMEVEHNLAIRVLINSYNPSNLHQLQNRPDAVITHKVPGALFEIRVPALKDNAGYWDKNALYIFYGKYSLLPLGNGVKSIVPVPAPLNANKLTLFNTVMVIEGGNDLIDKAVAQIDFQPMQSILQNPN